MTIKRSEDNKTSDSVGDRKAEKTARNQLVEEQKVPKVQTSEACDPVSKERAEKEVASRGEEKKAEQKAEERIAQDQIAERKKVATPQAEEKTGLAHAVDRQKVKKNFILKAHFIACRPRRGKRWGLPTERMTRRPMYLLLSGRPGRGQPIIIFLRGSRLSSRRMRRRRRR